MIEKVMDAMVNRDWTALAACFEEDGKLFDYCPSCNGGENWFSYGSDGIMMFYHNRLSFEHLIVNDPVIEDDNTANFFGAYDGPYIYARIKIEQYGSSGLIKKAIVTPA
jgi:hypothetical protein